MQQADKNEMSKWCRGAGKVTHATDGEREGKGWRGLVHTHYLLHREISTALAMFLNYVNSDQISKPIKKIQVLKIVQT